MQVVDMSAYATPFTYETRYLDKATIILFKPPKTFLSFNASKSRRRRIQEAQIHLSNYVFLLFAGDEKEDFSFGHDKMVNCVTACIQIARATDIIQQQKNLIDFFLVSLSPNFSWPGIAS